MLGFVQMVLSLFLPCSSVFFSLFFLSFSFSFSSLISYLMSSFLPLFYPFYTIYFFTVLFILLPSPLYFLFSFFRLHVWCYWSVCWLIQNFGYSGSATKVDEHLAEPLEANTYLAITRSTLVCTRYAGHVANLFQYKYIAFRVNEKQRYYTAPSLKHYILHC
jgi:hypothetical protein